MKHIALVLGAVLGSGMIGCGVDPDLAVAPSALAGDADGDFHGDCADLACGDGQLDAGEACDDGNDLDGDGCDSNCTATACGNGALTSGEACDDGNTADGDGCSALCQREDRGEIEPNGVSDAPGNPLQITGDITVHASISSRGDVDAFQVVVSTPALVRLETFTSFYECVARTTVRLRTAAGTPMATDSGEGINGCGAIVRYLDAGTYIVSVEGTGNHATIPSYFLQVDFQTAAGAEAETPSAVGANDTVATAGDALLGRNNAYVLGNHLVAGDVDVYAITVPPRARVRAEVIEGERGTATCESSGVDSYLLLYDEAGVALVADDDDGRGRCSLIDGSGAAPLDAWARNPTDTPRTYYLAVGAVDREAAPSSFAYRLQVTMR